MVPILVDFFLPILVLFKWYQFGLISFYHFWLISILVLFKWYQFWLISFYRLWVISNGINGLQISLCERMAYKYQHKRKDTCKLRVRRR